MKKKLLFLILLSLPLTGCVSRENADARLAKGCEAAAATLLKEGYSFKNINKSTFKTSTEFGAGFREVTLNSTESDGWANLEREYKCIFAEEMTAMGLGYTADFYQIAYDGEVFGKSGTELLGDADTLTKLTAAAQSAILDHQ